MNLAAEKRRAAIMLIGPAVLVLLAVNLFPIIFAVVISFRFWTLSKPDESRFAGLGNFEELFVYDDRFWNAIIVSLKFVAIAVAVEFVLGFLLAFVFNAGLRGLATLRKLAILPVMVMPIVTGLAWFYLFNENFGAINWFLGVLGLEPVQWLTDTTVALLSLVIADVWQWTPFVMLVLFAALQSLPEYVYEAAKMDGLSEWQVFWRITVPLLKPAIWIIIVLRIVDAFRMMELAFMMTRGGPAGTTEVLPYYIYVTGFLSLDLGLAAAMAILMLALITVITQLFIARLEYREV